MVLSQMAGTALICCTPRPRVLGALILALYRGRGAMDIAAMGKAARAGKLDSFMAFGC